MEHVTTLERSLFEPPSKREEFYTEVIELLASSEIPFLLSGTYALACYTGIVRPTKDVHGLKAVTTSFLVLFAAEWGDLSQLLTISLVAKYEEPFSVFLGAWGALLAVSGLAVVVGRLLLQRVRLAVLHYVGATVCVLMAGLTVWEMTR